MTALQNPITAMLGVEQPELSPTQQQILQAAMNCVSQLGLERVTLNDIAKEAGFARSTVYSHYRNKEDVIRFALLHSAYSLVEQLAIALLDTPAGSERIVEGIVLALEKLPNEPCLALITDTTLSKVVNEHTLTTEAGFKITTELFRFLIGENHLSENQLREQAEFAIRTMFSLLNMHSPSERNSQQLRSFIAHWLLPALGLAIPEKYSH